MATKTDASSFAKLEPLTADLVADLVARQSSTREKDNTMSVPDQVAAMTEAVERKGWRVGQVHVEKDTSGLLPLAKRKGLSAAVARVEAGLAHVVVCGYFDRLTRDPAVKDEVVNRVETKGGRVTSLDFGDISNKTAMQWYTGTITTANNKLYALMVAEKLQPSKQRNIDSGIPPFPRVTPAYRRREDGRLEQHPRNARIILEAIAMRLAKPKGASYTDIARWLNEQGMTKPDKDGVEQPITMTPGGVEQMFRSKLLVGEIHFGNFTPNLHAIDEPLISHATYRRLNSAKASRGRQAKSMRLLARLDVLVCGTCGARMTVDSPGPKPGKAYAYAYYRCGNRLCNAPAIIAAELAETEVWEKAVELAAGIKGRASAEAELEAARLAMEDAKAAYTNAIETLLGHGGNPATKKVLDELQATQDEKTAEHDRLALLLGPTMRTVRAARKGDEELTLDEARDFIRSVVAVAKVTPGRGPGRVQVEGRLQ